jgi:peptide methionine sulfoxide reductase MsrB
MIKKNSIFHCIECGIRLFKIKQDFDSSGFWGDCNLDWLLETVDVADYEPEDKAWCKACQTYFLPALMYENNWRAERFLKEV